LGTTYTVEQSGALELLDSLAQPKPAVVVGPSGQILAAAARGDVDVVITHAPSLEQRLLVVPGPALLACPFVASRFAVVGPPADPVCRARAARGPRGASVRAVGDERRAPAHPQLTPPRRHTGVRVAAGRLHGAGAAMRAVHAVCATALAWQGCHASHPDPVHGATLLLGTWEYVAPRRAVPAR